MAHANINALEERFCTHMYRHPQLDYEQLLALMDNKAVQALDYLQTTGGEPDVMVYKQGIYIVDFSPESPDRRSLCYDKAARVGRKKNPPADSAQEVATSHGVSLVSEDMYMAMQELDHMDQKTSSWILTPESIRELGGALFGCHKYGRSFIYHNGAGSYYAARGFRACYCLKS